MKKNINTTKTPSIKVLNAEAKLRISDDCAEISKWKLDDIPHYIKSEKRFVSGNIIYDPRLLILQRSSLLKVETNTGRIIKVWTAQDRKDEINLCEKIQDLVRNSRQQPFT